MKTFNQSNKSSMPCLLFSSRPTYVSYVSFLTWTSFSFFIIRSRISSLRSIWLSPGASRSRSGYRKMAKQKKTSNRWRGASKLQSSAILLSRSRARRCFERSPSASVPWASSIPSPSSAFPSSTSPKRASTLTLNGRRNPRNSEFPKSSERCPRDTGSSFRFSWTLFQGEVTRRMRMETGRLKRCICQEKRLSKRGHASVICVWICSAFHVQGAEDKVRARLFR